VGLSSVAGIDVDVNGQVATLRGTVASEEQKQQAEQAACEVDGITKVVNDLSVKQ
jgi:osmotically-inducible protein OsmY